MKKTIKLLLGAIMLVAITSCSNQNKKMLSMIPQDAIVVVNLKSGSIIKNVGLEVDSKGVLALPASLKSSMGKDDLEAFDDMAKKIAKIGIDPSSDIFVFASKQNLAMPVVAYVPLKDEKKTIKELSENKDFQLSFKENDGMSYALAQDSAGIVVKDNIMMVIPATGGKIVETALLSYAKSLFDPSFEGIMENKQAGKSLDEDDDINVYLNMRQLASLASMFVGENPIMQLYADVDASACHISFKDQQIKWKSEIMASDKSDYMKFMKQAFDAKPSTDFLKVMPENVNGVLAFNINGANIVKFAQVNTMVQQLDQDPELKKVDIPGTIASINGTVAIGLVTDYAQSSCEAIISLPSTKAQQVQSALVGLLSMFQGVPAIPLNNSTHDVQFQDADMALSIGYSGNTCYAKLLYMKKIASKGSAANNPEIKKFFDDNSMGCIFNFPVSGMTLHFDSKMEKDFCKSEGHFFITGKDGKKLGFLEYTNFFKALDDKVMNCRGAEGTNRNIIEGNC